VGGEQPRGRRRIFCGDGMKERKAKKGGKVSERELIRVNRLLLFRPGAKHR